MKGDKEPVSGPDITADDDVHTTRGKMQLRGPHLEVYRPLRFGIMDRGDVVGVDGLMVLFAHRLRFRLETKTLSLEDGIIFVKKGTTEQALAVGLNSGNPNCVRRMGGNALTLKADWLRRNQDDTIDGGNVWFTSCACSDGCIPLLSVQAVSAHIIVNDRANFVLPVIELFNWPSIPLPWISMPLTSRATGLLFPEAGFTGPGGDNLALPVFVTLGDSADVTVQGLYYFGTSNATAGGSGTNSEGVQGPGADIEFRWRPSLDASGDLHLFGLYDTSKPDSGSGVREERAALQFFHSQNLLGGHVGAAVNVASDSDVLADSAITPAAQFQSYMRSWVEYSRSAGPFTFSLESNYLEDLQSQVCAQNYGGPCFPRTNWRLIPAAVAPVAQGTVGTDGRFWRFMLHEELTVAYEDAWGFQPAPVTPHDRRLVTAASLTQSLPVAQGSYGSITLETGERAQDLLVTQPGAGLEWRGGGYAGLVARTTIGRSFASGWANDFVPILNVRGFGEVGDVPFSRGLYAGDFTNQRWWASVAPGPVNRQGPSLPSEAPTSTATTPLPQDAWDLALPSHPTVQTILSLTTHLTPPRSAPMTLTVEQHLALYPYDSGQLHASLTMPLGFNTFTVSGGRSFSAGNVGWAPATVAYTRVVPSAGSFQVGGSYGNTSTDDQIGRSPDMLFTPQFEIPPVATTGPPAISWSVFTHIKLTNFGPFHVLLDGTLTYYPYSAPPLLLQDYGATFYYDAEGCGRFSVILHWTHTGNQPLLPPVPSPSYMFGNARDVSAGAQSVFGPGS
jgi:hypothetical protein